ncbi:hypothetical protein ABZP36_020228 [Zizania latifolia]
MGWASSGGRRRSLTAALPLILVLLFFLLAASSLGACASPSWRGGGGTGAQQANYSWESSAVRRSLVGPGSSPPTCRSRCEGCHPCRPVHVAIQPGRSFPLEYYPEAWRCKCGDKLFMP